MKWIGLTGGIASGKSTVAAIIEKNGIPVVNADQVAHLALDPGSPVYPKILQAFGRDIVHTDGSIDRNKLGALIFKDPSLRDTLEKLVHPFVREQVKEIRSDLASQGHPVAVYDVPLLFEKNMEKDFDHILLVSCDPETQIQRLMKRNSLTREQAELRLRSQIPIAQKKSKAHTVIENTKSLIDLEATTQAWLKTL
jgi:dephospho-CoA kinase